jgi:hypothetical protein
MVGVTRYVLYLRPLCACASSRERVSGIDPAWTAAGRVEFVSSGGSRLSQRRLELLLHVPHHYLDSNLFNEVVELLVQLLRIVGSTRHLFEPGASPK